MCGITSLGRKNTVGNLNGFNIFGIGRGHTEDHSCIFTLLLGAFICIEKTFGRKIDTSDGCTRRAGNASINPLHVFNRFYIDYGMKNFVQLIRLEGRDDLFPGNDLPAVKIKQGFYVGLDRFYHYRSLIDQPDVSVLHSKTYRTDFLEMVLYNTGYFFKFREGRLAYLSNVLTFGFKNIKAVLLEPSFQFFFTGYDITGKKFTAGTVFSIITIYHRLYNKRSIFFIQLVDGQHPADSFQHNLKLCIGIAEKTIRQISTVRFKKSAELVGFIIGFHLRLQLLYKRLYLFAFFRLVLKLGYFLLNLQVTFNKKKNFVITEIFTDEAVESGNRIVGKTKIMKSRITDDGQIGTYYYFYK